jgi:FkbM family methyltransferase
MWGIVIMLHLDKLEGKDELVLFGVSDEGKACYEALYKIYGDSKRFVFTDAKNGKDFREGYVQVEDRQIKNISLEEFYNLDRNTPVFIYEDEDSHGDKLERIKFAGFTNIHHFRSELSYDYAKGMDSIRRSLPEDKQLCAFCDTVTEAFEFWYNRNPQCELCRKHLMPNMFANIDKIYEVYMMLSDEKSRETYLNVMKYRVTGDTKYLKASFVLPQYFCNDIFEFGNHEVIVDGGTAQGDTYLAARKLFNDKFDKYYMFEANTRYNNGLKWLTKDDERVRVIGKGLYSSEQKLYITSNGHGSWLTDSGDENSRIDVTSIDEAVPESVTFIKMDIEGSEMAALQGARETILRDKPKLAICIYHLEGDFWNIPRYIKSMVPEYKIYIRHHCDFLDWETVCYATL